MIYSVKTVFYLIMLLITHFMNTFFLFDKKFYKEKAIKTFIKK